MKDERDREKRVRVRWLWVPVRDGPKPGECSKNKRGRETRV